MLSTGEGILLFCSNDGRISKIHYNKISPAIDGIEGKLLAEIFIGSVVGKVLDFITDIKKNSASFGWEFHLKPELSKDPIYLSGAILQDGIGIFGSKAEIDFTKFLTGMMYINNDQTNKIRLLEKEKSKEISDSNDIKDHYFNELSRLNNELVGMQRELTKKNMELAELNKLKNKFLGMAAHDLRNPLGHIINFSEFIAEEKNRLSSDQIDFVDQIKSLSWFMLNMVTELLDVSAIESGEININFKKTDIVQLIEKVLKLNKTLADRKEINLNFNSTESSIIVTLDKGKIEQVFTNLLTNAIKYSFNNTEIVVDIKREDTVITISVKDEGQGIAEDELAILFKPFQTTSTRSTDGEKSTGLGLFIVKKIIEAHNGKIRAESELGKGSTFYVILPIVEE